MKKLISLAAGAALTALLVFGLSTPAFAPAVDMFMKIDGIDGESQAKDHKGEIDVLSWSWGETTATGATGERLSQPSMGAGTLTIVKTVDRASPKLQAMHRSKARIPSMTVSLPPDSTTGTYMKYELKNVMITSYSTGGTPDRPTEEVAFSYNKIQFQYDKRDKDSTKKKARDKKK